MFYYQIYKTFERKINHILLSICNNKYSSIEHLIMNTRINLNKIDYL
jgi:hypothetical protein